MYAGGMLTEPPQRSHFQERPSVGRPYAYRTPQWSPVDRPRPVEPLSVLQPEPPYTEPGRFHRHQDSFQGHAGSRAEYRPQTQSLPRLQDILTSAPAAATAPPAQRDSWASSTGSTAFSQLPQSQHGQPRWHPPLAFPPPHDSAASYPQNQSTRVEQPVVESTDVHRQTATHRTTPSYSAYSENHVDDHDQRRNRPLHPPMVYYAEPCTQQYSPAGPIRSDHRRSPSYPSDQSIGHVPPTPGMETSAKTFLRTEHVPGEGPVHIYRSGARIPAQVDGEKVNPVWGLTKANKARKRLAQACLECREKKIKCEPGLGEVCLNCEKYKRKCQKSAGQKSPNEALYTSSWPASRASPQSFGNPSQVPIRNHDVPHETAVKHRPTEDNFPTGTPSKRQKSKSPDFQSVQIPADRSSSVHFLCSPTSQSPPEISLSFEIDPFAMDPESTLYLLELFFKNANDSTMLLFPPVYFAYWVKTSPQKSSLERLVLYAVLAVGSIFADEARSRLGMQCADLVRQALKTGLGHSSMAVVQAQLLLGMFSFAKGATNEARDHIGTAINAVKFLGYNTEQGCALGVDQDRNEFRLDRDQVAECRRRTTWTALMLDRVMASRMCLLNSEDVFIRLPCPDSLYEQGRQPSNAAFLHAEHHEAGGSTHANPTAALLSIVATSGDITNLIFRGFHQPRLSYEKTYRKTIEQACASLQDWCARLPEHLTSSSANLQLSHRGGYAGQYLSMHALHHLALMRMHRYYRHGWLPEMRPSHIPKANENANLLLKLLSPPADDRYEYHSVVSTLQKVSPIVSYAILSAVDIVGAGGLEGSIKTSRDLIEHGVGCLASMGTYWSSAKVQHETCQKRLLEIQNIHRRPTSAKAGCWVVDTWGCAAAMLDEFPSEYDCIFGLGYDVEYFDILRAVNSNKTKLCGRADTWLG